jgi:hypothetical protein
MAALEIIVDVRDGQTMSQYKMPKSGKVKFNNADPSATLKITGKDGKPWPFCEKDNSTPKHEPIVVEPLDAGPAWICETFTGVEVVYNAQIGTAKVEDPIIIFEKSKLNMNLAAVALTSAIVGALAAVIIMRYLRPGQQG